MCVCVCQYECDMSDTKILHYNQYQGKVADEKSISREKIVQKDEKLINHGVRNRFVVSCSQCKLREKIEDTTMRMRMR